MHLQVEYYIDPIFGWLYLRMVTQPIRNRQCDRDEKTLYVADVVVFKMFPKKGQKWFDKKRKFRIATYGGPQFDYNRYHKCLNLYLLGNDSGQDHRIVTVHPWHAKTVLKHLLAYGQQSTNNSMSQKDVLIWTPELMPQYADRYPDKYVKWYGRFMQMITMEHNLSLY